VLETKRLRLRPHALADYADLAQMWADERVTLHIGGRAATAQESWFRLLRYAGLWPLLGFGYWAVEESESGRFVGEVGFADFHRDITPPLDAPETGWVLASWAHGRGFATEAMRAVLAWGDANLPSSTTSCIIDAGNVASVRVAAKCGYAESRRTLHSGKEVLVFERGAISPDRS
jgi:RimJ/RimL family protein N-acetyltransferase